MAMLEALGLGVGAGTQMGTEEIVTLIVGFALGYYVICHYGKTGRAA